MHVAEIDTVILGGLVEQEVIKPWRKRPTAERLASGRRARRNRGQRGLRNPALALQPFCFFPGSEDHACNAFRISDGRISRRKKLMESLTKPD